MEIISLPLEQLIEASWNPNCIDQTTLEKLKRSLEIFGLVQNLVVRPLGETKFEVLSGNQRLKLLREADFSPVPCAIVKLDDARARLLAQALNRLHGEDDPGLKAEVIRNLLKTLPQDEILSILPESRLELSGLTKLGQETLASHLQNWDQARSHRLRNLQFRLAEGELEVVQQALNKFMNRANRLQTNNPNLRGNALFLICQKVLKEETNEQPDADLSVLWTSSQPVHRQGT
jgi:ParB family transcriptional regulator, chromosome partitioning protein